MQIDRRHLRTKDHPTQTKEINATCLRRCKNLFRFCESEKGELGGYGRCQGRWVRVRIGADPGVRERQGVVKQSAMVRE